MKKLIAKVKFRSPMPEGEGKQIINTSFTVAGESTVASFAEMLRTYANFLGTDTTFSVTDLKELS